MSTVIIHNQSATCTYQGLLSLVYDVFGHFMHIVTIPFKLPTTRGQIKQEIRVEPGLPVKQSSSSRSVYIYIFILVQVL